MSESPTLTLRAVQVLISVPVLAGFVATGLLVMLPMLLCRFVAGRAATA